MERKLYYFAAIFLTIAITIGSLIPTQNVIELPSIQFVDKFIHSSGYFLLALSWLLVPFKSWKQQHKGLLISLLVFVYGIIIEVLQGTLTRYRQADFLDVLANLTGIVIAMVFFQLIFKENRMK